MDAPKIIIGCSGFYNKQWKGLFYPEDLPTSQWFAYYCQHFTTFEINATFYRFPTVKGMQGWYKKAPEGFTYAVKAPKQITHLKRFADCEDEIAKFYNSSKEGLAEKLGCILFQLPPSFTYSQERLELITSSLSAEFKNVVEFRHESWWREDVYQSLAAANITFCSVNYPKLFTGVIATTPTGYVRLHGNPRLFYSEYTKDELQQLYANILQQPHLTEAYIYFNNTASSAAIINALQLEDITAQH
ncbi:hypothetical protein Q766_05635 [Flavobacterium subsaxonicum WB 4.1-42 = DSM 21790]|uniref:Histidine kinase n=2 Tax=Flavobacterium TaxID=237 RepID=A0A0A2MS24_9FLAO|nr:hypothetical protein Q766_05635 [Flavobacterium subsaxonicum WB 4.1-42 = DSM 21790]